MSVMRYVTMLVITMMIVLGLSDAIIFDSVARVKSLLQNGDRLVQLFDEHYTGDDENSHNVQRCVNKLRSWTTDIHRLSDVERDAVVTELIGHPINAFNIIRDWVVLINLVGGTSSRTVTGMSTSLIELGVTLPDNDDYRGALKALVRLQITYVLPTTDLVDGIVFNRTAKHGLVLEDCYELGLLLMSSNHGLALSWFTRILDTGRYNRDMEQNINRQLVIIHRQAGNYELALKIADKTWNKDVTDRRNDAIMAEISDIQSRILSDHVTTNMGYQYHETYWTTPVPDQFRYYEELCRGEKLRNSILVNKHLRCIYRPSLVPYVQYKEEIHSVNPRISLIHDVISDTQATYLKQKAGAKLEMSYTESGLSDMRISKLSWVFDDDPYVMKISNKVSDITGLSTMFKGIYGHAEAFQVVNYGMGGQYEPHHDYFYDARHEYNSPDAAKKRQSMHDSIRFSGDRIGTFMFYLNDVTAGGATVFPVIGVRIPPVKNAAAFWYNFNLNGDRDVNTLHAGCPVLLGQKWVANKWIHEEGNMFKRPCPLLKNQVDPILYK